MGRELQRRPDTQAPAEQPIEVRVIRDMSMTPALMASRETAVRAFDAENRAATEARQASDRLASALGITPTRTAEATRADFSQATAALRQKLTTLRENNVGVQTIDQRNQQVIQLLERQLAQIEERARSGDTSGATQAMRAFSSIITGVEQTAHIVADMVRSGAPPALTDRVDQAVAFDVGGATLRATALRRVGTTFNTHQQVFRAREGVGVARMLDEESRSLVSVADNRTDLTQQQFDASVANLDRIGTAAVGVGAQLSTMYQSSLDVYLHTLGGLLTREISDEMKTIIRRIIQDITDTRARFGRQGEEPTESELGILALRIRTVQEAVDALSDTTTLTAEARRQLETVYVGALGALSQGRAQAGELILTAAEEIKRIGNAAGFNRLGRDARRAASEYITSLARGAVAIASAETATAKAEAETAMRTTLAQRLSGELRGAATTLGGESARLLSGIIGELGEHPERATMDNIRSLAGALGACQRMLGLSGVRMPEEERQALTGIFNRGLQAIAGGDLRSAGMQFRLMGFYASNETTATQRGEINQLSQMLATRGPAALETIERYMTINDRITTLRRQATQGHLGRNERAEFDRIISEMERMRANLATTGSLVPDQEAAAHVNNVLRPRMRENQEFRDTIASLVRANKRTNETDQQAEARILDFVARSELEEGAQRRFDELGGMGESFLRSMSRMRGTERANVVTIFRNAVTALLGGATDDARRFRTAGETYSNLTDARDRSTLMGILTGVEGRPPPRAGQSVFNEREIRMLDVMSQWSRFDDTMRAPGEARNARAYFDLAMRTARQGTREEFQLVMDMASAYGALGSIDPRTLPESMRTQRAAEMARIQRTLGDFSRESRRVTDIGAGRGRNIWMPREGQLTPLANAIVQEGTFTRRLGQGDPSLAPGLSGDALAEAEVAAGAVRLAQLQQESDNAGRLVQSAGFEVRCQRTQGASSAERATDRRYREVSADLTRRAERARQAGDAVVADFYTQEAGRVDRGFMRTSVDAARQTFQRGQDILEEGRALVREADSAATKTPEQMRARIAELRASSPPDRQRDIDQMVQGAGTDEAQLRVVYSGILRVLAQEKSRQGNSMVEDAGAILDGVSSYDRSVRTITTIHSYSGRRELHVGVSTLVAVNQGYDVDLLGRPVMRTEQPAGGGAPSEVRATASQERIAELRGNGRAQIAVGTRSVEVQERIQRARWRTIDSAQRTIRDASETRIRGIIDGMLQDGSPGNPPLIADAEQRQRFRQRLTAIAALEDRALRASRYQALYVEVGAAASVRTEERSVPDWLRVGSTTVTRERLFDANANYRDYRTAVGLAYRERFDAANGVIRNAGSNISESSALAWNRINERRLTLSRDEARGSSFGLGHLNQLREWGLAGTGVGIVSNNYDIMLEYTISHPAVALEQVGAMIERLPPAERAQFRERMDRALRGGESDRRQAVFAMWGELAGRNVNPPQTEGEGRLGRRTMTLLDSVIGDDLFYYDAEGIESRILRSRRLRTEGNMTAAERELNGVVADTAVFEIAERRNIERTRDERTLFARFHEAHPTERRGFGQPPRTARERLTREIPRDANGELATGRARETVEDNNAVRDPEIRKIEASSERSIGYMRDSARASTAAIDELLIHRDPVDIAHPEIATELYFALSPEAQRRYASIFDRLPANGEDPNTREARATALEFYQALRGNNEDFRAAITRMRGASGPGETYGNMTGVLAQLEADQATSQYRTWDYNEARARQAGEYLVQYAGTELDRNENANNRRYLTTSQEHHEMEGALGWAPHSGEYMAENQHRSRAQAALEFASALLDEGNARRAATIIENNEVITARGMNRETATAREWHDDHGLRLGDSYYEGREYSFRATDQLSALIYRGRMEVLSYYDEDAMAAARPRMQELAEMEIEHTLRTLGVQRVAGENDEMYYERWSPPNPEAARAFADAGNRLMRQLGEHDAFILGQSDASLLFGSWVGAEEQRYNEATFRVAERSWDAAMTASRGDSERSTAILGTVDSLASDIERARSDVQDWASYQRAAGLGVDIVVIAGTAVFAPEFLPGVFMMMGARGAADGLEMRRQAGEWNLESGFAFGMGVAGMVLVPLSEAAALHRAAAMTRGLASGSQWAERAYATEQAVAAGFRGSRLATFINAGQAERTAMMEAAQTLGEGRAILSATGQVIRSGTPEAVTFFGEGAGAITRVGQYLGGAADLTAFQRAVHLAGIGMMGAGAGMFLYHLPDQLNGPTTGLEIGLSAWLSIGQAVGQGAYAIRASGAAGPSAGYIPRPVQYLAAAAFGIPLAPRPAHIMARDSALAVRELTRMPAQERAAYETFRDRNRIALDPVEERAIVRDFNEARTRAESRGETLTFDSYMQRPSAEGARRLTAAAFESRYQMQRAGSIPATDVTPAMRAYAESRAGGAEPLDAAALALRTAQPPAQPQAGQPQAGQPQTAQPATPSARMAARRERAGTISERRQFTQDATAGIDRVASDIGATIPPEIRASATELAFHAERLATAAPAQRAEVLATIPERMRSSADILSREPEFRGSILTPDGARLETPNRPAQMRAALEEAASMPEHSGRSETSMMRLALNTERLIGMRDLTAEDLAGNASRYEERAARLREEGRTPEAEAWAQSARKLREESARRAPAAPAEQARPPAPRPHAAPAEENAPASPRTAPHPAEAPAHQSRRDAVRGAPVEERGSAQAIADEVLARSRLEGPEAWTVGGPNLETGAILRSVEDYVLRLARAGQDRDVVILTGDKTLLNALNEFLGREWGDVGLDAYQAILQRAIAEVTRPGEDIALVRPSGKSDETISVLVLRPERGVDVRADLPAALERATKWAMESPDSPFRAQFERVRGLVRDPVGLAAATTERSQVIRVRQQEGGQVTATYHSGENAFIIRPEGNSEFLTAAVTRTDDPRFAPRLRAEVGLRADPNVRPALEPVEESRVQNAWQRREAPQSNADRAAVAQVEAALRARQIDPAIATPEQVTAAIREVGSRRVNLGDRDVLTTPGVAFEIRLSVTDPAVLSSLRETLPETGKGLAEVLSNMFGIRGFNTFFGHDGANTAVNQVESAVAAYATSHNLTIRRKGTCKYYIEGGTPEQARALMEFVSEQFQRNGMHIRVSQDAPVVPITAGTTVEQAFTHVSNGHMVVERRSLERRFPHLASMTEAEIRATDWDGEVQRYADANALINAMNGRMATDSLLQTLLGDRYNAFRPIIELIRGRRDIRNFEDLILALRDPQIGGSQGRVLEGVFRSFVVEEGRAFRIRVESIPRPMEARAEAQAARARIAVGAEEESAAMGGAARREDASRPALPYRELEVHRLEREVGGIPQPRADAVFSRGPPELLAIARAMDAMVPGSSRLSEGGLADLVRRYPEYAEAIRAMNSIEAVGRDLVIQEYAPRILFERALGRLELAISGSEVRPEVADMARLLLRAKHGRVQSFEEGARLDLESFTRIEERMALGMNEIDAVLSVARETSGSPAPQPPSQPSGPGGGSRTRARPALRVIRGTGGSQPRTEARGTPSAVAPQEQRPVSPPPAEAFTPGGLNNAARRAAAPQAERRGAADLAARREETILGQARTTEQGLGQPNNLVEFARSVANGEQVQAGSVRLGARDLLHRMNPRVQGEVLALANDPAFVAASRRPAQGAAGGDAAFSQHVNGRRAEIAERSRRVQGNRAAESEAAARTGTDDATAALPSAVGRVAESRPISPESPVAMSGSFVSPSRFNHVLGAYQNMEAGRPSGAGARTEMMARQANEQVRRGVPRERAVANILEANPPRTREDLGPTAMELLDVAQAMSSGNPDRVAAARRHFETLDPAMQDALVFMLSEGSGFAGADVGQMAMMSERLARSIELERGGLVEPLSESRLRALASAADKLVYNGDASEFRALSPTLNGPEAIAFARMGRMMLDAQRSGTGRARSESYVQEFSARFAPEAPATRQAPTLESQAAHALADYQRMLQPAGEEARVHNPAAIRMYEILRANPAMPREQAARQAVEDVNAATRLTADYELLEANNRRGFTIVPSLEVTMMMRLGPTMPDVSTYGIAMEVVGRLRAQGRLRENLKQPIDTSAPAPREAQRPAQAQPAPLEQPAVAPRQAPAEQAPQERTAASIVAEYTRMNETARRGGRIYMTPEMAGVSEILRQHPDWTPTRAAEEYLRRQQPAEAPAEQPHQPAAPREAQRPAEPEERQVAGRPPQEVLGSRQAIADLAQRGITPVLDDAGALRMVERGGERYAEFNITEGETTRTIRVPIREPLPQEPTYMYQSRMRAEALDGLLRAHEEGIRESAPENSTLAGRRLYTVAFDQSRSPDTRLGYGTPNEREVAAQLRSDSAYTDAMARQDYPAALAIAERYSTLLVAVDNVRVGTSRGEHVDVVTGARRVIAIGDVHGDAHALVDQLTRGGVLIDTMPHLAADDASVPLAQRYRINPDLARGTQIVFTGDFVDRGPTSMQVLDVVRQMQSDAGFAGSAVHTIRGNHEALLIRFVEAYRGYTTDQVRDILRTGNLPDGTPDPLSGVCQFNRVGMGLATSKGVPGTFEQIVARYGTWEAFVARNFTQDGAVIPGSEMDFVHASRGAVIIDNNYFTHGGPVMTPEVRTAPTREAAIAAIDDHFTGLFGTRDNPIVENSWSTVWADQAAMDRGDHSANYVNRWHGELSGPSGQEFRQALGIDQVYIGHMPTDSHTITRFGDFATGIDVGMTPHYGGGRGFLDINPLNRESPVAARSETAGPTRDITGGRSRTNVLRNPVSEAAETVLDRGGSIAVPPSPQPSVAPQQARPPAPQQQAPAQVQAPAPARPSQAAPARLGNDAFQAELARVPDYFRQFAQDHFTEAPDAPTMGNALALFGERTGDRSGVFGDFHGVLMRESMGGNAGRGHAAVNGYFDRATGRIIAFGNIQDIPPAIVARGVRFTMRVNVVEGTIHGITSADGTVPPQIAALDGMQVQHSTAETLAAARRAAGGQAQQPAAPEYTPLQLQFQRNDTQVLTLERHLPHGTDERSGYVRRLARDFYRYLNGTEAPPAMYRQTVDNMRANIDAGSPVESVVVQFATVTVDTSGMVRPGSAAAMESTSGNMQGSRPLEAVLPRDGANARDIRRVARVLERLDESIASGRMGPESTDPEYQQALRAIGPTRGVNTEAQRAQYITQWAEYIVTLRGGGGDGGNGGGGPTGGPGGGGGRGPTRGGPTPGGPTQGPVAHAGWDSVITMQLDRAINPEGRTAEEISPFAALARRYARGEAQAIDGLPPQVQSEVRRVAADSSFQTYARGGEQGFNDYIRRGTRGRLPGGRTLIESARGRVMDAMPVQASMPQETRMVANAGPGQSAPDVVGRPVVAGEQTAGGVSMLSSLGPILNMAEGGGRGRGGPGPAVVPGQGQGELPQAPAGPGRQGQPRQVAQAPAQHPVAETGQPMRANAHIQEITSIDIGGRQPWAVARGPEQVAGVVNDALSVYSQAYRNVGLQYHNPAELLGRMDVIFIARDAQNRPIAFATFSESPRGLRLALIGAMPNSREGRAAVRQALQRFSTMEGAYGNVSGRVADIVIGDMQMPVVPYDQARRMMGGSRGGANAQRDAAALRTRMGEEAFAASPIVRAAMERTGKSAAEITFDDLVAQAVHDGEIPNQDSTRANCFGIVQTMEGPGGIPQPTLEIKLMVGRPTPEPARAEVPTPALAAVEVRVASRPEQMLGVDSPDFISGVHTRVAGLGHREVRFRGVFDASGGRFVRFQRGSETIDIYAPQGFAAMRPEQLREHFESQLVARLTAETRPTPPVAIVMPVLEQPANVVQPAFEIGLPKATRQEQVRGVTPVDAIGFQPNDPYFRENGIHFNGTYEVGGRRFAEFTLNRVEGEPQVRVYLPDDATLSSRNITRRQYFEEALRDARRPHAVPEQPAQPQVAAPAVRPVQAEVPVPAQAQQAQLPAFELGQPRATRDQQVRGVTPMDAIGMQPNDAYFRENNVRFNGTYEVGGRRFAEFTLNGVEGQPQVRVYMPDDIALASRGVSRRQYFEQALLEARRPGAVAEQPAQAEIPGPAVRPAQAEVPVPAQAQLPQGAPAQANTESPPSSRRAAVVPIAEAAGRSLRSQAVRENETREIMLLRGERPLSDEVAALIPANEFSRPVMGIARMIEELAATSRPLENIDAEYRDAVSAIRAASPADRASVTANQANAIFRGRGGELGYTARRAIDRYVDAGRDRERATTGVERALLLPARYREGFTPADAVDSFFVSLIDSIAARQPGRPREVIAFEVGQQTATTAAEVANHSMVPGGGVRRPSDQGEAFAYDIALRRARDNGRQAPSSEDYIFGASALRMVRERMTAGGMDHLAPQILTGTFNIVFTMPLDRMPAALDAYMRAAGTISERIPESVIRSEDQRNAVQTLLTLSSYLLSTGIADPQAIFTNSSRTGLLDIITIARASDIATVSNAAVFLGRVAESAVGAGQTELAVPAMRLMLEDAARLNPDRRAGYLTALNEQFSWSEQLGTRVAELDSRTGASGRRKRMPMLAYMMDPSLAPLIAIMDNSVVRNRLSTDSVFREFTSFLDNIRQADLDVEGMSWLAVVRQNIEYLGLTMEQRMARGISEDVESSRTSFITDRIHHLNTIYEFHREGRIQPGTLRLISEGLTGRLTTEQFSVSMGRGYMSLAPEIRVSEAWVSQHLNLFGEYVSYRRTLALLGQLAQKFPDYIGRPQAFREGLELLDRAFMAHVQGRFADFKFSPEFRAELRASAARAGIDGDAVFRTWSEEHSFNVKVENHDYAVQETGTFDAGFYSGMVRGATACQSPRNMHPTVGGIIGSVVQPWMRQVVIGPPGSSEATYRRWMVLVQGENGRPTLLLQPAYQLPGTPPEVDAAVVAQIRQRYEPLGVEVRVVRAGVDERFDSTGRPENRGYGTYTFRAPFVYLDSNMVEVTHDGQRAQNGLVEAPVGQTVEFPVGSRRSVNR